MNQNLVQISATIVVYNEDINELRNTINCFFETPMSKKLFIVDNTRSNIFEDKFSHSDIEYIPTKKNIGFAAGNNLVLDTIKKISNYHLILNPDVSFEPHIIQGLIKILEKYNDVALIAPKVVYPDGSFQNSCRRYPSFFEMINRFLGISTRRTQNGKYIDKDLSKPFYPDVLHGCFMMFNTKDFVKLNGFDERYFLYMEDVDICRKIDKIGKKKIYFPDYEIIHNLKKESSKKLKHFIFHTTSVLKYFFKWGL